LNPGGIPPGIGTDIAMPFPVNPAFVPRGVVLPPPPPRVLIER
jgi:hypothetical protein